MQQSSEIRCLPASTYAMVQETDERLYQLGQYAEHLPMDLSPLARESLKANLDILIKALQMRGVDVEIEIGPYCPYLHDHDQLSMKLLPDTSASVTMHW